VNAVTARVLGRGLAGFAHGGLRIRRDVVRSQIAASFPERDAAWVRHTARASYRHFGAELSAVAGGSRSIEAALARVRDPAGIVDKLARARDGFARVIVTGHIGNWELAGAYLASRIPVTTVVRRQQGGWDRRLLAMREGMSLDIVHHDEGARKVVRALEAGRCVSLVADQHSFTGSASLPFLGRPAWTRLGPARLALRAGVPLAFGALIRDGDGYDVLWEPVGDDVMASGDAVAVTREWLGALERAVRRWPAQYYWFHRRWKKRSPGEGVSTV